MFRSAGIPATLILVFASCALARPVSGAAEAPSGAHALPGSFAKVDHALEGTAEGLVALRRDLHQHPELPGEEARTAGLVAKRMRALGLKVRTGVGGHGVVAVLRGARPGPVVAIRADMDAFASTEPDPVAFRSMTPGVRHGCGHDVHTAVAVGVATGLAAIRGELPGTIVFIFQPAEENAAGARAMLADSVLADPRPQAIFAFHTAPLNVGQIGSQPGTLLAGRDMVVVSLGGHGDLQGAARKVSGIIRGLTSIAPEQAFQPLTEDFVLVSAVQSAPDPKSGRWVVTAFVTTASDSLRAEARRTLDRGLAGLQLADVSSDLDYRQRTIAGVINDPDLEGRSRAPIRAVVGNSGLVPTQGVYPAFSEDFGFFEDEAPGVMFWLGVSNPEKGTVGIPHSPAYVADDGAILVGARTMAAVLLDYLESAD
jgi:metal-dependent amidase/aminoacylase/carboxypeptidase family protein